MTPECARDYKHGRLMNRVFSLTWPASVQIYWNKRKSLHKKRVQLPEDWFGTPTWPPFHCFGTPTWPPWRHVKTLYWSLLTTVSVVCRLRYSNVSPKDVSILGIVWFRSSFICREFKTRLFYSNGEESPWIITQRRMCWISPWEKNWVKRIREAR